MQTQPEVLLLAGLIILLAYFIRGITGFGSSLIAVPLLAHFLPLTLVVPVMLITDFSASLGMSTHTRKQARWDEIRPLVPFGLLGVLIGVVLLINLPRTPLLIGLGLFVLFFGLRTVLNLRGTRTVSRGWAIPAGLFGGMVGALFGAGGPPYVIYLNHRLPNKSELRATLTGLFLLDGGLRVITFLFAGLLLHIVFLYAVLAALPLVGLGLHLGHRFHLRLAPARMQQMLGALLIASASSLLWRAVN